jgi:hypothetical protein
VWITCSLFCAARDVRFLGVSAASQCVACVFVSVFSAKKHLIISGVGVIGCRDRELSSFWKDLTCVLVCLHVGCRERISHVLIAYQRSLRISASGGGGGRESRTGNRDEEEEEEKEEECFRDFLSVEVGGNDA